MAGESAILNREMEIFGLVLATTCNDLQRLAYAFDVQESPVTLRVCVFTCVCMSSVCACACDTQGATACSPAAAISP
jgi:hypothetical protein